MKTLLLVLWMNNPCLAADWSERCIPTLTQGYASPSQAETLCWVCSQAELGCAMDLFDMQQFTDFIEAAEYCRAVL